VLEAQGITASEAALALLAAQGLAGLKTRETSALTLRRVATDYGFAEVATLLNERAPLRKSDHSTASS
jgi:hypothetical protein